MYLSGCAFLIRGQIMDVIEYLNELPPQVLQIVKLCIWLVILAAIFTPLERLFALHPKKIFRKAILTDLGYYFVTNLALGILLSVPVALLAWSVHHFIPSSFTTAIAAWPLWLRVIASFVVGDIGFYWGHRWSHEVPFLWRFHAIHHSAEHVDYLVNTRAHPIDMVFTRFCGLVPLYILGLATPSAGGGGRIALYVVLVGTIWGFFIHANVRWRFGPLEWLVATPAFHHWHHTNDGPEYIDKNYAATLPWIDKIFGTLYLPKNKQPERYGIDQKLSPLLVGQLVHPFMLWRKDPSSKIPGPEVEVIPESALQSDLTSPNKQPGTSPDFS
jgi:sterol desaturase/sphingolipid hydroxylase (fatty acid hydroxylase superfamily)